MKSVQELIKEYETNKKISLTKKPFTIEITRKAEVFLSPNESYSFYFNVNNSVTHVVHLLDGFESVITDETEIYNLMKRYDISDYIR